MTHRFSYWKATGIRIRPGMVVRIPTPGLQKISDQRCSHAVTAFHLTSLADQSAPQDAVAVASF